MGRKKIKIEPIEGDRNRSATYLKRKYGLFKKAYELAVLTDSDIAVIVFGRNGKLAEFCSGDIDEFLLRYTEYNGTVEKRGPEHLARDGRAKNDDQDDGGGAGPEPCAKRERTHSMVHASSRARLDSRRQSNETATSGEEVSPRVLASHAALASQSGEAFGQLGRRKESAPSDASVPASFVDMRETPLRMANSWDSGSARLEQGGVAAAPVVPDAVHPSRRWSSRETDFAASPFSSHVVARRLSGTPMTGPEMALQDATSRMLPTSTVPAPPGGAAGASSAPQGMDGSPNLATLAMPANPAFGLPMNVNFLDPAPSPTKPAPPPGGPKPAPPGMLAMSPGMAHDGRLEGSGVLTSPLTPGASSFAPPMQAQVENSYSNTPMKIPPAMQPTFSNPLTHEMKRYVPTQGPEIFFPPSDKPPLPGRAVREPGPQVLPGSSQGFVLPQEPPLSPTESSHTRSMFVSQ